MQKYAREKTLEVDDISLETEVGGAGARAESIVLTDLYIVGAVWSAEQGTLVDLNTQDKTFNRYLKVFFEFGSKWF